MASGMSDVMSSDLWLPQRRGIERTIEALSTGRRVCLYAPTGGGKSRVAGELFRWAVESGRKGIFFVNRRLLIGQTSKSFDGLGVPHGIRAAEYGAELDSGASVQISSIQTEYARVYKNQLWSLFPADLVIVDEAHLQKGRVMRQVLSDYDMMGAKVVLMTATPVGLSEMADELIISGTMKEYRECKALVPARVFSLETPDMRKVKRNNVGEYVIDGRRRQVYVQSIVGSVIQQYNKRNPDRLPAMLYAPCVASSIWITGEMEKAGIPWCHVDANDAILDGQRFALTRWLWEDISGMYRDGTIKGISSRFRTREGIDFPESYMCILATPMGSLSSYIQTVGRVLRYSKYTPDEVIVLDHGGNYLRHGSPNVDRDWRELWDMPVALANKKNEDDIAEGNKPEPIRCPECGGERPVGITCPHCGFKHERSKRIIIMEDGRLIEKEGHAIPRKRIKQKPDTQSLWSGMFFGWRKKQVKRTFRQMRGYFIHKYGYAPPETLDHMPTTHEGWRSHVYAVPSEGIRWPT